VRVEELHIEGFGPFASKQVGPFTGSIVVIHGVNEAGKSTLLAFIRMVLFGFPRLPDKHYPPLAGGQHGGHLTLVDSGGHRFIVERFRGTHGGPVSIKTGDGTPVDEATLRRLLSDTSSDVFKNVFAFSLDELQEDKSLQNADVDSQIYSAGIGAARLPVALKAIRNKKNEIFRRQGRKNAVAELIAKLEVVGSGLDEARGNAAKYGGLVGRLSEIGREIESAGSDRAKLQQQSGEVARLRQGWDDWVALVEVNDQLRELPSFDGFPENAVDRLETAQERVGSAKRDLEEDAEKLKRAEESAEELIADESLLEHRDNIERIRRGRASFDASVRDLPERKAELRSMEAALGERLRDLGPDWDEGRLDSFDTSIGTRDHIEVSRQTLAENHGDLRERTSRLDQAQGILKEHREAEHRARNAVEEKEGPSLDAAAVERKRTALRATRTRLEEYTRQRQRHTDFRGQLESSASPADGGRQSNGLQRMGLPLLLALAAVVLMAAGAFLGQQALIISGFAGFALLGVIGYILIRGERTPSGVGGPVSQALAGLVMDSEIAESEAEAALKEAAEPLGLSLPDAVALDAVEGELDSVSEALRVWEALRQRLADATQAVQQQQRRTDDAAQARESAQEGLEVVQGDWRTWLVDRGLAGTLTPETMVEFRGSVETARVALGEVRTMRSRIKAIEHDIDEYRELTVPLADTFGTPIGTEAPGELAAAADALIARYVAAGVSVNQRDVAREDAESVGQRVRRLEMRLEEYQDVVEKLLGAGGTDDPEEFRRRATQHEKRRDLERRRGGHLVRLQQLSGPGEQFERFKEGLAQASPQALEETSRELAELVELNEEVRNTLLGEQGEKRTLLGQLTSEEESSALRVKRNVLMEELREQAREWSKLTIAEDLLLRTRTKFEEERQPGVILHAQEFFGAITNQRYPRLYAPIGEQTVTVIDENGVSKQPSELSRGTREQLYLALRFGLIREFGERTECLPVVVDEVLVNFDPDRARRAAEAFVELSKTNQVLVFTCHPEMVDLFTGVAPDTQVIEL
jgi:uncharacterized protein YhaN